ncbi:unnamed protein product [Musa acuminata subsp. malaccensis]|uniref:(wild Malaysian banana) hypothetical protein n=1 Tax=Musa acuminata subsp. malaccensis TaxID=214687 RepID=A0A804KN42_MUSAM|nr:unnamed protein product [Musa acuminata subsp. malaccensis]
METILLEKNKSVKKSEKKIKIVIFSLFSIKYGSFTKINGILIINIRHNL